VNGTWSRGTKDTRKNDKKQLDVLWLREFEWCMLINISRRSGLLVLNDEPEE
jgi:hypothetical protein